MSDQAQDWQEVAKAVKKTVEAVEGIPAPPNPDDQFGVCMNGVNSNLNSLKDHVYNMANTELENREDEDE